MTWNVGSALYEGLTATRNPFTLKLALVNGIVSACGIVATSEILNLTDPNINNTPGQYLPYALGVGMGTSVLSTFGIMIYHTLKDLYSQLAPSTSTTQASSSRNAHHSHVLNA